MKPRVPALLTLVFLLVLPHQYSSSILEHKGLVYHSLEILKVTCFQRIGKSIIQFVKETLLLLFVVIHVIGSVAGKIREMSDILTDCHTLFRERGNEASICVPKMFKSHAW
jgi:hypothetical protein